MHDFFCGNKWNESSNFMMHHAFKCVRVTILTMPYEH